MPLVMQVGLSPHRPFIMSKTQCPSVTLVLKVLQIQGRHDPCVALRAVPVVAQTNNSDLYWNMIHVYSVISVIPPWRCKCLDY